MPTSDNADNSLPKSRAKPLSESANDYPYLIVDFGDGFRVIECVAGIQWIVQRRVSAVRWNGQYFCRTREALLHYSGHPDHPTLLALSEWFPEDACKAMRASGEPYRGAFQAVGL
jgi:hypothetical protein